MHPELFRIGPFALRSYGVFMAAGFGVGGWWLTDRARARGLPPDRMLDLVIGMVIAGLLGGRLMYVLTHWAEFRGDLLATFWPVQPDGSIGIVGLVYYGGILLAIPTAAWLVRRWDLPPLRVLDAGAPALAVGTAVGRLGCFFNGCCYGKPTSSILGIVFPPGSLAGTAFPGTPIHPTQLYMVFDNLLIAGLLLLVDRWRGKFDGTVIGTYLVLIGITRGLEDLFRYYESSMRLFEVGGTVITVNHLLGLGLLTTGALLLANAHSNDPDPSV